MEDNSIKTNLLNKGLITDLKEDLVSSESWSYARNATLNSNTGQLNFMQFEQGTLKCVLLPYTLIGCTRIKGTRWVLFMTNNTHSEIGIFDEATCTYTKVVNDDCLNFNKGYPIQAKFRELSDCTEVVYWTDAYNPRRYLNLQNVPYKFTTKDDVCKTKEFTEDLDCDRLLVDKNITIPKLNVFKSSSGQLRNGQYSFAAAYSINKQRISDFYSLTQPIKIWTHINIGQSITVQLSNLDRDFDEYQLAVVYTVDNVTYYKSLGFFQIGSTSHIVSNVNRPEYDSITSSELIISRPKYPYADLIESNDLYLMWAGLKTQPDLNYQLQAMKIVPEYVVNRLDADAYRKGEQKQGYMGDERYAFGIQWLFDNGEWSSVFHIPGIKPEASFIGPASGGDLFEDAVVENRIIPTFEVYETAKAPTYNDNTSTGVVATGTMGYWHSSELYPNRPDLFGDSACTPIRHHKFPDDSLVAKFSNGGKYINILGIRFKNIEHPRDVNGNDIPNIQGYRILRSNREGQESVIAKGVLTNVRKYKENNEEVLYANYPYNDLREDTFISSKQTESKFGEKNFQPLKDYSKTEFNFYSPETQFNRIGLGNELKIYSHLSAKTDGFFDYVHNHPKQKMITEAALWFSIVVGVLDGYLETRGKRCYVRRNRSSANSADFVTNAKFKGNGLGGITDSDSDTTESTTIEITNNNIKTQEQTQEEQLCDSIATGINSATFKDGPVKFLFKAVQTLAKAGMFVYFALKAAQDTYDIIYNFSPWQKYALQYNSHAFFTQSKAAPKDFRRRRIEYYQYLSGGLNTVEGKTFNNYNREESVYLRVNKELRDPETIDKSRNTLNDLKACKKIFDKIVTDATVYYGAIKRYIPNQYGTLESINYLDTGFLDTTLKNDPNNPNTKYNSEPIFGGDVLVTRMTVKRTHHFFSQFTHNVPDGFIYNYRNFRNIGYPRYWMDSTPYDVFGVVKFPPTKAKTPKNSYNLDCGSNKNEITVVKDKYFYLFNSGVLDFFVESPYNLEFRDWKDEYPNFYSSSNTNLKDLFRADRIEAEEDKIFDNTYLRQLTEIAAFQQSLDFSIDKELSCNSYIRNHVIYSMPANQEQKGDSWLTYLPLNRHIFSIGDFGNLTTMKAIDNQRIMFLFDRAAPYITPGRDQLQLDGSGSSITLGNGNLFERTPIPIAYTDMYYGGSQSKWAFINTQYGAYYPSQDQGRLFQFGGGLNEIGINGMSFWLKNNMPSHLLKDFPNYPYKDNPIKGNGFQIAFDNHLEILYITKKDYKVVEKYRENISFNTSRDTFMRNSTPIELTNSKYFIDCSWTLSYDPKQKVFVSFHDWHPDWIMQSDKHFFSVKDKTIWKHNQNCKEFCKYYGVQYPFQVEPIVTNGQNVFILRSLEFQAECGFYHHNCSDFHTLLDETFDYLRVYNAEQDSGLLKLHLQSKKDMRQLTAFPYYDPINEYINILYEKSEQKFRINQFDDIIKDRGEFTHNAYPIYSVHPNGYIREFNPNAIDYSKPTQLRKKFRNTWHKVLLTKENPGDKNIIMKFLNSKQLISIR